eukprot:gene23580-biopygen17830
MHHTQCTMHTNGALRDVGESEGREVGGTDSRRVGMGVGVRVRSELESESQSRSQKVGGTESRQVGKSESENPLLYMGVHPLRTEWVGGHTAPSGTPPLTPVNWTELQYPPGLQPTLVGLAGRPGPARLKSPWEGAEGQPNTIGGSQLYAGWGARGRVPGSDVSTGLQSQV